MLRSIDGARIEVEPVAGRYRALLRVRGVWELPAGLSDDLQRRSDNTEPLSFTITAHLTPFSRHVEFEATVDNTVRDHRLRVLFATGRRTNAHHAESAFAVVSREQRAYDPADFHIEVPAAVAPMQGFVTVEDDRAGVTLFSHGLPEYELKHDSNGILALTLLRCVGQLSQGPLLMRPGGRAGWYNETPDAQCQGTHTFRFGFLPHPTGWAAQCARIRRTAESFLLPIRVHAGKKYDSPAPDTAALHVEPESLALSAFKEAEDGGDVVVRIFNPTPQTIEGRITLGFAPAELRRADLEESAGERLSVRGNALHDRWPPFRIHTYRLRASEKSS